MKNLEIINPFPTTGYYGPTYFCDREDETKKISELLLNGQSCILMGNRRLGKTALIHHVKEKLPKKWVFIYLDILATENEKELLNTLGSALLNSYNEKSTIGRKIWDFIKGLQPTISFDQYSGIPQVSFSSQYSQQPIKDIFSFLTTIDQMVIVAIDEFQQINQYPEKNTDAWLRSIIQQLSNVRFIFSGSQQSILSDLFSNPSKPFFKSASPIKIEKINKKVYKAFILNHFNSAKKLISEDLVDEILDWTKCYTYYVQHLCNKLFQVSTESFARQDWQKCAQEIIQEQQVFFIHYRTLLSKQQWKLLVAIARDGQVSEPTSKNFIHKHTLGSAATVFKSIDALLEKDMIFKTHDMNGDTIYEVYDVFFERWIQQLDHRSSRI